MHPDAVVPKRNNQTDAGADICSVEEVSIPPMSRCLVRTGIAIELPNDNIYCRIAPRSGLAHKHGIDIMAGVIDKGYTGEIKVVIFNSDKDTFQIKPKDKIAQLIFERYEPLSIKRVDVLSKSDRGEKGFGSSDTKAFK